MRPPAKVKETLQCGRTGFGPDRKAGGPVRRSPLRHRAGITRRPAVTGRPGRIRFRAPRSPLPSLPARAAGHDTRTRAGRSPRPRTLLGGRKMRVPQRGPSSCLQRSVPARWASMLRRSGQRRIPSAHRSPQRKGAPRGAPCPRPGSRGRQEAGVSTGGCAFCASSSAAAFIDRRTRPLSSASSTLTRTTCPSFK